jgi:adenylylsulfate kinase
MKILICGLPGSGKTTLAEPFSKLIGAVWINADKIRTEYDDWDFSPEGRIRQAQRMKYLADGIVKAGKICVADFVAPTRQARHEFGADYIVWMDTVNKSQSVNGPAAEGSTYEQTDAMYEPLTKDECNYHVSEWFSDTHQQLVEIVSKYMADYGSKS